MKTKILIASFIFLANFTLNADSWLPKADWTGILRSNSAGFSIGNFGYACGGSNLYGTVYYNDLWEYDVLNNSWSQKADFPGVPRIMGLTFSINGKAYVGCGEYRTPPPVTIVFPNDFYEYNPQINSWSLKASPPDYIYNLFAFSIDSLGYIGLCTDTSWTRNNRVWQYSPATDSWTQKSNCPIPITTVMGGCDFTTNSAGYLCLTPGYVSNTSTYLWEYEPVSDVWVQKANFPGISRSSASAIGVNNKGYYGTGAYSSGSFHTTLNDWWEYDPNNDIWTSKTSLPDTGRAGSFVFVVGNRAYLGCGIINPQTFPDMTKDLWEYTPDSATGISELNETGLIVSVSPNPFTTSTTIVTRRILVNPQLKFFDSFGNRININTAINSKEIVIMRDELKAGIYFYELYEGKNKVDASKFIIY